MCIAPIAPCKLISQRTKGRFISYCIHNVTVLQQVKLCKMSSRITHYIQSFRWCCSQVPPQPNRISVAVSEAGSRGLGTSKLFRSAVRCCLQTPAGVCTRAAHRQLPLLLFPPIRHFPPGSALGRGTPATPRAHRSASLRLALPLPPRPA